MKVTEIIHTLLVRDRVLLYLVAAIFAGVSGALFGVTFLQVVSATLLFTVFDCYGYYYLTEDYVTYDVEYDIKLSAYRIIQNIVFALIITVLWLLSGWSAAAVFVIIWWFGACDFLYYEMLQQIDYMNAVEDMYWLWWTPYGIVLRLAKKPIGNAYLKLFTLISGLILVIYAII